MNYNMIFIGFLIIILSLLISFAIRNAKVCKFRIYILNTSFDHLQDYYDDIDWNSIDWEIKYKLYETASSLHKQINDKYEYDEMLFSIKPLRLDEWFTEEECNFIEFGTLKR